jgi:putative hydrolase of the HAD superfamily
MTRLNLVFDLDDTLYPERDFAVGGFVAAARHAAERYCLDQDEAGRLAASMTALLDTGHLGRLFSMTLSRVDPRHTRQDLDAFIDAYRMHTPQIALFDDAYRALENLGRHHTLALITDGTATVQRSKLAALGVSDRFASIILTDTLGGREFAKPNPKSFALTAEAIGRPGDRFIYIGDNPAKDFAAPNALGWTTIMVHRKGVPRIHPADAAIAGGRPHHTVPHLDALASIIELS